MYALEHQALDGRPGAHTQVETIAESLSQGDADGPSRMGRTCWAAIRSARPSPSRSLISWSPGRGSGGAVSARSSGQRDYRTGEATNRIAVRRSRPSLVAAGLRAAFGTMRVALYRSQSPRRRFGAAKQSRRCAGSSTSSIVVSCRLLCAARTSSTCTGERFDSMCHAGTGSSHDRQRRFKRFKPPLEWPHLIGGPLDVREVSGGHIDLTKEPQVAGGR